jgi:hypothetical protein
MLLSKGLCLEAVLSLHFILGAFSKDSKESNKFAVDFTDAVTQPHAHITDDLLVAAAACVELASGVLSDDLS